MDPFISILMTAYNRKEYIGEAIESVLASTYQNFELIISDDCSTDNTVAIARQYALNDKRIRLYVNEKNLGQFPNRNKAAGYAGGEYLMNVDSDDTIFPDGIRNCVSAMLAFPQASFGMYLHGSNIELPFVMESKDALEQHFFQRPFLTIGPGGTIIRRSFFNQVGHYPENYGVPGDMFFNLKAVAYSPVVMLPFEFLFYRRHQGQEINNHYSYLTNNYLYFKDALIGLPLHLTNDKINWLQKKNDRRFFVNVIKYLFATGEVMKVMNALKQTKFSFRNMFRAIFQV